MIQSLSISPDPALVQILDRLNQYGHSQYGGESVSQLDHALQCATLAEAASQPVPLVVAALLHDFGHLIHHLGEDAAERGLDDRHEERAIPWLKRYFGAAVTEPIRLHVAAKRYLCAVESDYWEGLSPASKLSLQLQGDRFTSEAAQAFIAQPYAPDAVRLRRWDDLAKDPQVQTPSLDHFIPLMRQCLI